MKNMNLSLILAVIAGGVVASSVSVEAADTSMNSTGEIQFSVDEEGVTPTVDPENPDVTDPINPDPGEVVGPTKGALRFDSISNLYFGTNKLTAAKQNYYPHFVKNSLTDPNNVEEYAHFVQVTDDRGGTDTGTKGWKVSVKHDGIFKSGTKKFNGFLEINNLNVRSANNVTDVLRAPLVVPNAALGISNNQDNTLLSANGSESQGLGTWSMAFGSKTEKTSGLGADGTAATGGTVDTTKEGRNPAVKLTVPEGQIIDADKIYKTTIIWTLSDSY